jgi:LmbE family N-acetylglucosaminyl deacetylase
MEKLKLLSIIFLFIPLILSSQPEVPVEEWTGKTILLIGAHPDDDHQSHGTLALLQDNNNEIFIVTMTTGNVGTKDPKLSRNDLAKIRRQEQLNAMKAIGLSEKNYINLGYDDGRLEYADHEELIERLVFQIRKIKPDVLFAFDPGYNYQVWHKSDHRAAAYLAADAVRAAEWPLLFPGHIIHDGLEAHLIPEFIFYGGNPGDKNTTVDITDYANKRIEAGKKYISQWSSGWNDYKGPNLSDYSEEDQEAIHKRVSRRIIVENGRSYERFRYHKGAPDSMGHGPRD